MKHLLIKMNYCWADEFDVDAIWVTTKEAFEDWKKALKACDISDDIEIYFGTNEFVSFNSYNDIIRSLRIVEVTSEEAETIIKYFGNTYGMIDLSELPSYYLSEIYDDDDD